MFGPRHEVERLRLLVCEQAVVGAEPRAVLRVRARVVGKPAQAHVAPYRGDVLARRVDDVVHPLP